MHILTRLGWAALVLTLSLGAVAPVKAQSVATRGIHTTIVDLPVPAGYVDATTEMASVMEKMVTGRNRLLAVFLPAEYVQLARAGQPTSGPPDRWILVQTPKAAERMNVGASDFIQVRRELRESLRPNLGEAVAQTNERLARLADGSLRDIRIGQAGAAQLEADTPDAIVVSFPATVTRPGAGAEQTAQRVMTALAMVRVKNKVVGFYASKAGEDSPSSLAFVRAQALQLASRALAINP